MSLSEIKEMAMIAISMILLSSVIWFGVYLLGLRNDFANAYNDQNVTSRSLAEYSQFNIYDNADLTGVDVVSAIRDYYEDDTIRIGVKDETDTLVYEVDKKIAKDDPSKVDYDFLNTTFQVDTPYKAFIIYDDTYSHDLSRVHYDSVKKNIYFLDHTGNRIDPNNENVGSKVMGIIFIKQP